MLRWLILSLVLAVAACGGTRLEPPPIPQTGSYKLGKPYQIGGRWYVPEFDPTYDERGIASWYGPNFHGRPTANGEVFDRNIISAAHTTLPLPSLVEVTNLENGRQMVIRVNDRGPFVGDRIIDLSEAAAKEMGFHHKGLADVRVRFLRLADDAKGTKPKPTVSSKAAPPPVPEQPQTVALAAHAELCPVDSHFVQVAALSDAARAQAVADQVRPLGPVWREVIVPSQGSLHRVRVGPVSERRLAFDILSRLRQMGYQEAYVADCASLRPHTT